MTMMEWREQGNARTRELNFARHLIYRCEMRARHNTPSNLRARKLLKRIEHCIIDLYIEDCKTWGSLLPEIAGMSVRERLNYERING